MTRAEAQILYFVAFKKNSLSGFSFGPYGGRILSAVASSTTTEWDMNNGPSAPVIKSGAKNIHFWHAGIIGQLTLNIPVIRNKHYTTIDLYSIIGSGDIGLSAKGFGVSAGYTFRNKKNNVPSNSSSPAQ